MSRVYRVLCSCTLCLTVVSSTGAEWDDLRVETSYWAIEVLRDGNLQGIGTLRFDGLLGHFIYARFDHVGDGYVTMYLGQTTIEKVTLIPPHEGAVFSLQDSGGYPTTGRLTFTGKPYQPMPVMYPRYGIETFEIVYQGQSKMVFRPITDLGLDFKKRYLPRLDLGANSKFF